ncbi:MAG: serine hydrolase domain-containing protein [Candidatus Thorarchaeota archaeon]
MTICRRIVPLFLGLLVLSSLATPLAFAAEPAQLARDYWPTDAWQTSTPEDEGMNSTKLDEMLNYLENDSSLTAKSAIIVKNGYIVLEEYFNPTYDENRTLDIYSCTSSIISALIGIAVDNGFIANTSLKVLDFFPERVRPGYGDDMWEMTIEHLLTNTAGFSWEENSNPTAMKSSGDWIQYVLDRPLIYDPGVTYEYNSGLSHVLSGIIEVATEVSTLEFAQEYLFDPLGIVDVEWSTDNLGITDGTTGCDLSTPDMAKFGYLYLNNGTWDQQQIVPSDWVNISSQSHAYVNSIKDYGYLWWIYRGVGAYNAVGFWSHVISVIPEHDLVVVVVGSDSSGDFLRNQFKRALTEWIIPSAIDDVTVGNTSTNTTTSEPPPGPLDMGTISLIAISGLAAVVIVAVIIKRR